MGILDILHGNSKKNYPYSRKQYDEGIAVRLDNPFVQAYRAEDARARAKQGFKNDVGLRNRAPQSVEKSPATRAIQDMTLKAQGGLAAQQGEQAKTDRYRGEWRNYFTELAKFQGIADKPGPKWSERIARERPNSWIPDGTPILKDGEAEKKAAAKDRATAARKPITLTDRLDNAAARRPSVPTGDWDGKPTDEQRNWVTKGRADDAATKLNSQRMAGRDTLSRSREADEATVQSQLKENKANAKIKETKVAAQKKKDSELELLRQKLEARAIEADRARPWYEREMDDVIADSWGSTKKWVKGYTKGGLESKAAKQWGMDSAARVLSGEGSFRDLLEANPASGMGLLSRLGFGINDNSNEREAILKGPAKPTKDKGKGKDDPTSADIPDPLVWQGGSYDAKTDTFIDGGGEKYSGELIRQHYGGKAAALQTYVQGG